MYDRQQEITLIGKAAEKRGRKSLNTKPKDRRA
jgi:hypothetical protein